jgi:two-component system sensor histidine kinase MprB
VRVLTVGGFALANGDQGWALQFARSLAETDRTLSRIKLLLFLIAGGGIAVAGALGLAVSGAALAPVRRLTQTTEEVSETRDLSRRIDARGRDELSRLAGSFNTMLAALEESARAQRQLVSDASHELRTPLTSLRTNIEVLSRENGLASGEREQLLRDVGEQLVEMSALVAELVELARGDGHPEEPEDVRLDLVAAEAIARTTRNRPGVVFEPELEETLIRGVPATIERAVSNLLDNAAKWSPTGGKVDVIVRDGELVVRDRGPGIAAEDLPFVFDRFYRASSARSMPGSGLGLAIVRQVAEAHGGSIAVEAPEDGGTLMRLRLPVEDGATS